MSEVLAQLEKKGGNGAQSFYEFNTIHASGTFSCALCKWDKETATSLNGVNMYNAGTILDDGNVTISQLSNGGTIKVKAKVPIIVIANTTSFTPSTVTTTSSSTTNRYKLGVGEETSISTGTGRRVCGVVYTL